jgi:chromosome segregation ATPase
MEDSLKQKQVQKQIRDGLAEEARLKTVSKDLETFIEKRRSEIKIEIEQLDTTLEDKKGLLRNAQDAVDSKNLEVTEVQDLLTQTKGWVEVTKESLNKVSDELIDTRGKTDQARATHKKTLATIASIEKEALNAVQVEKEMVVAEIKTKQEQLSVIERSISKVTFIQSEAEKALGEVTQRNGEQEKTEKYLRNKITDQKNTSQNLIEKEAAITEKIKEAKAELESDSVLTAEAKSARVAAEAELEEVTKRLLASVEGFSVRKTQLDSREENLKQAYKEAGIEWPNIQ